MAAVARGGQGRCGTFALCPLPALAPQPGVVAPQLAKVRSALCACVCVCLSLCLRVRVCPYLCVRELRGVWYCWVLDSDPSSWPHLYHVANNYALKNKKEQILILNMQTLKIRIFPPCTFWGPSGERIVETESFASRGELT